MTEKPLEVVLWKTKNIVFLHPKVSGALYSTCVRCDIILEVKTKLSECSHTLVEGLPCPRSDNLV